MSNSRVSTAYRRHFLPYGKWTCADGREVLFNRLYIPLWQRQHGITSAAREDERVPFVQQEWFYKDDTPRRGLAKKLTETLRSFGAPA